MPGFDPYRLIELCSPRLDEATVRAGWMSLQTKEFGQ